ncbi:fused MFS/spermidine synthase [Thermobifida halotolerans]|nr:fused MFS/spermidine synthase [Thermobifida halotolerans]
MLATAVVFLSSAVVLVLEVSVIRLVAPYSGDTLETYTAAIGVALAAIALGAKAGGDGADRWRAAPLLAALLILGGGGTLLARPVVLLLGPQLAGAGPITALLLVAFSIALPVALLSAVAPVVVKTQLADLEHGGSVVGRFSAWGTAGGLAGTVLTGYVLVAMLPVSTVLLVSGGAVVLLGLLFALRGGLPHGPRATFAMLGVCLVGGTLLVGVESPCDAETAYYCARVEADPERPSGRVLYLDDLRHGYVDLADPTHLEFAYTQWLGAAVDSQLPEGPVESLHVGGGAYTVPRWLAASRPGSTSTVLEVDPAVTELARQELDLRTGPGLTVVPGDARTSVVDLASDSRDLVVGDAFGGLSVPWHLTTREFAAQIRRVLRPEGLYVANVIDRGPRAFLAAQTATLGEVFTHVAVVAERGSLDSPAGGNHVVVASDAPLDTAALAEAVAAAPEAGALADGELLARWRSEGLVLTDDHAPVDQLLTPYLS